ncbi:oligopeptidase A [Pseudomonas sp. ADAK18]|uniref:M3 family metallopeptidase n=1 Tax=Pseudomonas sp. ADAK18 TaxID=2730848 RepID=UPI001462CC4C|nr:M3 family metallopeptidase [Pseudomonas sp. ADAK18]QJI31973.1 oligopeptidase A [Pseudomonas sp. ADAK18]
MPDHNPLLQVSDLPSFSQVRTEHLASAAQALIADSRRQVGEIIQTQALIPTWDDLVLAMDDIYARLDVAQNMVTVLSSTVDSGWKSAASDFHRQLSGYRAELAVNAQLYALYVRLDESPIAALFDPSRQRILEKILSRYRLSGVTLPATDRDRLTYLTATNAQLESDFSELLIQATAAWSKHVEDDALLEGVPTRIKDSMATKARAQGLTGWLVTLEAETVRRLITDAQNRTLRQQVCEAFFSRASDIGPHAGLYDNSDHLVVVMEGRHEIAKLLGYDNFAQLALENQMVESTDQVLGFFQKQLANEQSAFASDRLQLQAVAATYGVFDLKLWDYAFFSERLRLQVAGVSPEQLREYFTLDDTLFRLCGLLQQLFGVQIVERTDSDTWAASVRLFEVREYNEVIGYVFFEPFWREGSDQVPSTVALRDRHKDAEGLLTRPIAVLQCNFMQGPPDLPYLLDHTQLRILFHEFGHCLQQVLTSAESREISSLSGYGRDTSEFIGEFLEQWCFHPEVLIWLSHHYQTGERLPNDLADKQLAHLTIQTSGDTAELLISALFDFELHRTWGDGRSVKQVLDDAAARVGHLTELSSLRPANQLTHIMQGYAASLYSYRWSGVLAKEAFQRFQREGLFNPKTGRCLREAVLAPGNSRSLRDSLQAFLGVMLDTLV